MQRSALSFLLLLLLCASCSRQPVYTPAEVQEQEVAVPVSQLENDIPRFYTYHFNGKNISFFVIRMDQKVVSFLDACASCYRHKMGYRYDPEHSVVICRYCDMKFSIYKLEKGIGGCYPIKLEGRLENGTYRIRLTSLQEAAGKF